MSFGHSQNFLERSDSIHKGRLATVSTLTGAAWAGSISALHFVWYADYPKSKFHFFDDSKEWMQMDKVGHFYTAYHLSHKVARSFYWSGLSKKASNWIGTGVGFGYQLSLELLDATSAQWGFSWSDVAANTSGVLVFGLQEIFFDRQIFRPKFSFSPSGYAHVRPNTLGSTFPEQLLKDYNGQTYWLSFSPFAFSKNEKLPKWLCFSVGYSVNEKINGLDNTYLYYDRVFQAKRQFLFSLDLDVSQFHFKRKWPKILLSPFNMIKIPFPALSFTSDGIRGHFLYF